MIIPDYNPSEQETVGTYRVYPAFQAMFKAFGFPVSDTEPRFNRPITPKENMKLLFLGQTPFWIPEDSPMMVTADTLGFFPRQTPDNFATRLVLDGGEEPCVFPGLTQKSAWFDLNWQFVPAAGGATVAPGAPKVPDMAEWERYVSIPNLDDMDWDGMEAMKKQYFSDGKFNILNVLNGPWERLMSLMNVSEAAMALIDEDQYDGIHRFFDAYCIFFDDYITRVAGRCSIDGVLMHDDWGHQNSAFFSPATAKEMLLPYLKRIVASCHKNGLIYEQHSCGRNEAFIEMYAEAGVDLYCPQNINDFDYMLEKCKDSQLVLACPTPMLPPDASPEQVYAAAQAWFDHYGKYRVMAGAMFPNSLFYAALYEISRKAYAEQACASRSKEQ